MQRMELTPFVTRENGTRVRARSGTGRKKSPRRKKARWQINGGGQMMIKVGICCVAALLVLGLQAIDMPFTNTMVDEVREVLNTQTEMDEMLGKLQFVELPGLLEVFSGDSAKMSLAVNAPSVSLIDQECLAKWEGAPGAEVVASAPGEVRAVGTDPVLGPYVRLMHQGDLETVYYGLNEVLVEVGQPIRRLDTLGILGDEGTLCLGVLLEGRPQEPGNYFDLVLST